MAVAADPGTRRPSTSMDARRRFRDPHRVAQVRGFEPLAAAGAPLEYWFFRVTTPGLALLVDFIVRSRASSEVRVSYWNGGLGQVARTGAPSARGEAGQVDIAGCSLTARASRGRVGELQWDLALDPGPTRLDPRNALVRRLRPFDMELVSWPRAEISGTVTVHGHRHPLSPTPALLTHYWGQRLPVRWPWISANQFAGERVALEAMVLRTHLWSARR